MFVLGSGKDQIPATSGSGTLFIVSIGCDLRWNKPIKRLSKISFLSEGKRMESELIEWRVNWV